MAAPEATAAAQAAIEHPADLTTPAGVFPPFDANYFVPQLVWLVIIFGALYWLMSRVALPRVGGIIEARNARIGGDLAEASRMQEQAAAASAAYDATLAEAKGRAQSLAQDMHERLHRESETKRHALDEELNRKLAQAEEQISATKASAMSNVEGIAREAASAIIEHLTGRPPRAESVHDAVASVKVG